MKLIIKSCLAGVILAANMNGFSAYAEEIIETTDIGMEEMFEVAIDGEAEETANEAASDEASAPTASNEERSDEGTAYAVLTSNGDMIFFRSNETYGNSSNTKVTDIMGNTYTGTVYTGVETYNGQYPRWSSSKAKTARVADGQIIRPINLMHWFEGWKNLQSFDTRGFDTSKVTNMDGMFVDCSSIQELDLRSFDTSNVKNMRNMFLNCSNLRSIQIGQWDAREVTTMAFMFSGCTSLISLDLSGFTTSKLQNMESTFSNCINLASINLTNFNTDYVLTMTKTFYYCRRLTELDLTSFDVGNCTSMMYMFSYCSSLVKLDLSSFNTHKISSMSYVFTGMDKLEEIKLGPEFTNWYSNIYNTGQLPAGNWFNAELNLTLTEKELYEQYSKNAAKWAGTWQRELPTVHVTGVSLDKNECMIAAGKSLTLKANISPVDAENRKASWKSDNPEIASVDQSGHVKGNSIGTTVIHVITDDGSYEATCQVRVLFSDVADSNQYYYTPVYWAVDKGITNGYRDSDGFVRTFKPQNNCTREAIVTFLWRLADKPEPENMDSPFKDVQNRNAYYYKAVLWAAEQGITKGYSDGTFKPNATCLREHVVTFLWRYAKQPAPKTSRNPFNDVKSSDYYYKAAIWANENGIAKGYSSGAHAGGFGPKLDCLREHVVTFLYRYAK